MLQEGCQVNRSTHQPIPIKRSFCGKPKLYTTSTLQGGKHSVRTQCLIPKLLNRPKKNDRHCVVEYTLCLMRDDLRSHAQQYTCRHMQQRNSSGKTLSRLLSDFTWTHRRTAKDQVVQQGRHEEVVEDRKGSYWVN